MTIPKSGRAPGGGDGTIPNKDMPERQAPPQQFALKILGQRSPVGSTVHRASKELDTAEHSCAHTHALVQKIPHLEGKTHKHSQTKRFLTEILVISVVTGGQGT